MKKTLILITLMFFTACSSPQETLHPSPTVIPATGTHSPTETTLPSPTPAPTITPTPIHPENKIVFHEADDETSYRWFSYVPSGLDRNSPIYILLSPIGYRGTYDEVTANVEDVLRERLGWPNIDHFVLLAPVIPLFDYGYPMAFDLSSFTTSDEFVKRADIKVNKLIDDFSALLKDDEYRVEEKILIEGYSAGAMFAQRYTLLHPERVLAIAAGQCGGNFTLPLETFKGAILNWPVGINDLDSLSSISFDQYSYVNVHQFIYIGDQDSQVPNTILFPNEWGKTDMWQSVSQRDYLRQTFGNDDPSRMSNQIEYLRDNGYGNIIFKTYPGIGHQETHEMIVDKMNYLLSKIDPSYVPTITPTPGIPIVIDGYADDWVGFTKTTDETGDSYGPDIDIKTYNYTQDANYLDIMIQTNGPITSDTATFDIGLSIETEDGNYHQFEFNINNDGSSWGGNHPDTWYKTPGVLVAWEEVVEIQIPKSIFKDDTFSSIEYISLFTNVDGEWTFVDSIQ